MLIAERSRLSPVRDQATVAEALTDLGVKVGRHDVAKPGLETPIHDGDRIVFTNVRVVKRFVAGEEVPFGTVRREDASAPVGQDTVLSQIIKLVEEAQIGKAPMQQLADRVASYFVPIVVLTAVASSLAWYFIGQIGLTFTESGSGGGYTSSTDGPLGAGQQRRTVAVRRLDTGRAERIEGRVEGHAGADADALDLPRVRHLAGHRVPGQVCRCS